MIYLDNASTTRISPVVLDAMLPYLQEEYGNAGTLHQIGRRAAAAVEKSRQQVSSVFGCEPENIIFTSGGTESNNLAIKGARDYFLATGKRHIITTAIEHDSVMKSMRWMQDNGFEVTYINPTDDGVVPPKLIEREIREDTGLVAVMYVNNEVGAVNDIAEIGRVCNEHEILFHSDCVQALGCKKINTHFITGSISSHKIHGAKGVGALYVRQKELLQPIISGGGTQEFGVRGGTENVAGIVGFGVACELAMKNLYDDMVVISTLKQEFASVLASTIGSLKDNGIHINGASITKPGKILNLRIDGVSSETLMLLLDTQGICVSAGSACRAHESEPSHVLIAMGLSPDEARSSIRFSFSKYNTLDEVTEAAQILASSVNILRQLGE